MKKYVLALMILCAVMFNVNIVNAEEMAGDDKMAGDSTKTEDGVISQGKVVKFDFVLTVDGQVVDSSEGKEPLEYTHGTKMLIPGLEKQLEGLKVGDKKTIMVSPDEAYGPVHEEAFLETSKEKIGLDVEPKVGMIMELTSPEGQPLLGTVAEVKDDTIVLDFNHPLAGKELKFDVEIVDVQ